MMDEITTEEFAAHTGLSIEDLAFTMRLANSIMSEDFNWGEAIQMTSKVNYRVLKGAASHVIAKTCITDM